MSNRDILLSMIKESISSINSSSIEVADSLKLVEIEKDINNFSLYLPLIGSFNAGKSSLINSFLDRDELLPTNIIPETAVATEIYYDEKERIEIYKFDNQSPLQIINSLNFSLVDTEKVDYLKVYINSKELKKYNIILVDMPGLDSNIKRHNQSILNYMTKDISFIFLLNIEDGTIRDSSFQFLKEIKDYRLDFFTLLNKIDKKLPNEIEEIKGYITNQLSNIIENPSIGTISAIDNKIDDFKKIIENINIDDYIQKLYYDKTKDTISSIIFDLITRLNAISLDTKEIDKKISELLSKTREIDKEFEAEKRRVEDKFSQTLLSDILISVENILRLNINTLIQSIEVSDDSLNTKINDLIRPVITSKIKNYSESVFVESIKNIETKSNDIFSTVTTTIDKVYASLFIGKTILPILPKAFAGILGTILTKINPVVAVLSTVVSIIFYSFTESKEDKAKREEQERRDKIRDHLENRIIPSIPSQIAPSIQNSLEEIKDNFFTELKSKFDEKVENIQNSLNIAKQEKEEKKDEIEKQKEKYIQLISRLKGILGE